MSCFVAAGNCETIPKYSYYVTKEESVASRNWSKTGPCMSVIQCCEIINMMVKGMEQNPVFYGSTQWVTDSTTP